jgi:oxaloacetate decarboxylase gamma subunit
MLEQSGVLTLLGMGIVFGFLVVMIICISTLGKVIHALGWDKDVQQAAIPAAVSSVQAPSPARNETAITAVISAAVTEYRKTHE